MKIGEAYSRGYRDCSKVYNGTGKWWIYLTLTLAVLMGMALGVILSYAYFVGV